MGKWQDPMEMTEENIKFFADKAHGNYRLGKMINGKFVAKLVGRDDFDVQGFLLRCLSDPPYPFFMARKARNLRDAFETECLDYHELLPQLDNIEHPHIPVTGDFRCPVDFCTLNKQEQKIV